MQRYKFLFTKLDRIFTTEETRNEARSSPDDWIGLPTGFDYDRIRLFNKFVRSRKRRSSPLIVVCTSQWRYTSNFLDRMRLLNIKIDEAIPGDSAVPDYLWSRIDEVDSWAMLDYEDSPELVNFPRQDRVVLVEDGLEQEHLDKVNGLLRITKTGNERREKRGAKKVQSTSFSELYGMS